MKPRLTCFSIMVAFGLISLTACASPGAATQPRAKSFKIFEAWGYEDTPNLESLGFHKIRILSENSLTSLSAGNGERAYSKEKVQKMAAVSKQAPGVVVALDMESWGHGSKAIGKYTKVVQLFKSASSGSTVGMYGYVPYGNAALYRYFDTGNASDLRQWKELQADILPLAKATDVFMPSLYSWGTNLKAWEETARKVVKYARAVNPDKPIYAFLWPQYYGNAMYPDKNKNNYALRFIPPKIWQAELETLYPIANGVIIWSYKKDAKGNVIKFSKSMPWFQATLAFMREHNIK